MGLGLWECMLSYCGRLSGKAEVRGQGRRTGVPEIVLRQREEETQPREARRAGAAREGRGALVRDAPEAGESGPKGPSGRDQGAGGLCV